MKNKKFKIVFISTYVPRECGIATYTQDIIKEIKKTSLGIEAYIIALSDQRYSYPKEVIFEIDENNDSSYIKAAELVNSSDIDVVSLQHEFNIFGGFNGKKIVKFLEKVKKPVIMTLHTLPIFQKKPYLISAKRWKSRSKLLREIFPLTDGIITMNEFSKNYILSNFDYKGKIEVIYHGAPDISPKEILKYKEEKSKLNLSKKDFVILTFGLINEKKGLEYVIKALPSLIKENPKVNIKYFILGKTHPKRSPKYLEMLKKIARDLNLENNVIINNKYLSLEEIFRYCSNADVFITPYYVKEQTSSGVLTYAIDAGCCIVSTPYIYAKELIEKYKIGEIIKFKNPKSIVTIIGKLIKNPQLILEYQKNSLKLAKKIHWSTVGKKFLNFFQSFSEK